MISTRGTASAAMRFSPSPTIDTMAPPAIKPPLIDVTIITSGSKTFTVTTATTNPSTRLSPSTGKVLIFVISTHSPVTRNII